MRWAIILPEKQKLWIFRYDLDYDKFRIYIFAMTVTISGNIEKKKFIYNFCNKGIWA